MAEMTAQAAALVVSPGLVLTKLEHVHANKWVRYEDSPVVLELRGRHEPATDPHEEHVRVGIFNRGPDGRADATRPVFEAVAVFAVSTPAPPPARPWELDDPRPSRFTAESLYGEQWLFHGPAFQALVEVGAFSEHGIDGVLRVLPWEPLLPPGQSAGLHTDLIVTRQLHAPARLLGPRLSRRSRRRRLPAPHGGARALRRSASGRHGRRVPHRHRGDPAAPGPRVGGDRPAGRDRLDAAPRLGGLAVPLAEPLSRRLPPAARRLPGRGVAAGRPRRESGLAGTPGRHGASGLARRAGGRRSSIRRNGPSTWLGAVPRSGVPTGSGAGSPPRRPRGGSGGPRAGGRPTRRTSPSSSTNGAGRS